jgi:glycosyltransferase involved in cell wall biosynthesis
MKIISTSYSKTAEYTDPHAWLKRISFYTGVLEALAKQDEVISIERINYEGRIEQNGVLYYFIKLKNKIVYFPFRMHRLIKSLGPDVVLVNGFIFPLQIIQLKLKLGKKSRILIMHRAEKPSGGIKKYFQKLADKCVDAYLFTSFESAEEWVRVGTIKNKEKIYEVIQASSGFHAENSPDKNVLRESCFIWVGRLDANKDPLTVIRAFIRFLRSRPSAKLYMIYQEETLLKEVGHLIDGDELATNAIELIGRVPHEQLQLWYNRAGFIISGSHYEGSGIAVSEGMSCGCIPVVTDIPSFRKMTGGGKCGFLYEAGNADALLKLLLRTQELDVDKERKKTIEQFHMELSFEAIANKINHLLKKL